MTPYEFVQEVLANTKGVHVPIDAIKKVWRPGEKLTPAEVWKRLWERFSVGYCTRCGEAHHLVGGLCDVCRGIDR